MAKPKTKQELTGATGGPVLSVRFVLAVLLMVLGIAWVAYYYLVVRVDPGQVPAPKPGGPAFLGDLGDWNYAVGFGLFLVGLAFSAHPSTPLGRGRGVVVGMLACFLLGLFWICIYYVVSDDPSAIPVMNDLGQYNLILGIAFMAVGFTFATRWE